MSQQGKSGTRGIATMEQLEKRLSSIALGRVKKPEQAKISEQLKAMELLVKMRAGGDESVPAGPLEVKIRVLDAAGREIAGDRTGSDAPAEGVFTGRSR